MGLTKIPISGCSVWGERSIAKIHVLKLPRLFAGELIVSWARELGIRGM
jgi:hypothetical protein